MPLLTEPFCRSLFVFKTISFLLSVFLGMASISMCQASVLPLGYTTNHQIITSINTLHFTPREGEGEEGRKRKRKRERTNHHHLISYQPKPTGILYQPVILSASGPGLCYLKGSLLNWSAQEEPNKSPTLPGGCSSCLTHSTTDIFLCPTAPLERGPESCPV